ncbi:MAG: hypothetical protein JZU53_01680 [Paludibacter sp.]|nr:hypothetical protein [Paludibacter sp.]
MKIKISIFTLLLFVLSSCNNDEKINIDNSSQEAAITKTNEGFLHFESQSVFDDYLQSLEANKDGIVTKSSSPITIKGFKSINNLKSEISALQTRSGEDDEVGSEEEYNLSRCESVIQDEVLMNVLDTTMRISIGGKYYKITDNGTFCGSIQDTAKINTIATHYDDYKPLFVKTDELTYSYEGITFKEIINTQTNEPLPASIITKSFNDIRAQKESIYGLDKYNVSMKKFLFLGCNHTETKNFDDTHRVLFKLYNVDFLFVEKSGMKLTLEKRKKIWFVKYWVSDNAQDRVIGFNEFDTEMTIAASVPMPGDNSQPKYTLAKDQVLSTIAGKSVNLLLATIVSPPFMKDLYVDFPAWLIGNNNGLSTDAQKIYDASFGLAADQLRSYSKSNLLRLLKKSFPDDPLQVIEHTTDRRKIKQVYVGQRVFGGGEEKSIVFNFSGGITLSFGNGFSIKPFEPTSFKIKSADVYGAVKYNNQWLGIRFIGKD